MAGCGSGDGMVIDLSPMRAIDIDPIRRVARVEPGLTCHDVAQALRPYGLAVDNLRSVELIAADGQFLTASADDNPELFWGLRAGGGNFGIATAFEFDLHPAGVIAARTA
jgi:FAD/FMN-containing dehydrogenase